jgi:hypothetical protein
MSAPRKIPRLDGLRFSRLVVTEELGSFAGGIRVACVCDCGTQREVRAWDLLQGLTKSCGCLHRELSRMRTIARNKARARNGKK